MRNLLTQYGTCLVRRRPVVETLQYEVVERLAEVELRRYPRRVVATAPRASDYEAHMLLYDYITGKNRESEQIEMTAPVISDGNRMCFVMPSRTSREMIPEPLDNRIRIQEIPAREVAVLRFSDHADEPLVAQMTARLLAVLNDAGIRTVGKPFLMRYNPPTVAESRRRNEVAIEILQGQ